MDEEGTICDACGNRIGPHGCCATVTHLQTVADDVVKSWGIERDMNRQLEARLARLEEEKAQLQADLTNKHTANLAARLAQAEAREAAMREALLKAQEWSAGYPLEASRGLRGYKDADNKAAEDVYVACTDALSSPAGRAWQEQRDRELAEILAAYRTTFAEFARTEALSLEASSHIPSRAEQAKTARYLERVIRTVELAHPLDAGRALAAEVETLREVARVAEHVYRMEGRDLHLLRDALAGLKVKP